MRYTAALVAACLALGCDGFELVGPEPNRPTALYVQVTASEIQELPREVRASLVVGTDGSGEFLRPSDRAMRIGGDLIDPESGAPPSELHYRWQPPTTVRLAPAVEIRGPTIRAGTQTVTVPVPSRIGDELVTVFEGDDLRLPVSPGTAPSPNVRLSLMNWQLVIGRKCTGSGNPQLMLNGASNAGLAALRVPSELLADMPRDSITACVHTTARHDAGGPYDVTVIVYHTTQWRIRIVDRPAPGTSGVTRPTG